MILKTKIIDSKCSSIFRDNTAYVVPEGSHYFKELDYEPKPIP